MIQFNLLPDVKLEFIKAQRVKRLVISLSVLVSLVAVGIFILLLLFVDVAQKKHLSDLNRDIDSNSSQLTSNSNLNKILTIQSQISTLPSLESQTPVASRIFAYMTQLTPSQATVSSLVVDYTQNTFTVTGDADSLATVNQFVDTLKFTTYKGPSTSSTPAFSNVVLSAFNYAKTTTSNTDPATYTITFSFDPLIFSNVGTVTLTVPSITTTRSVIEQPSDLFQQSAATSTTTGTN